MKAICEHCRFFEDPLPGSKIGLCRRYPPQISQSVDSDCHESGGDLYSVYSREESSFPEVGTNDWCGEYKAKK
jgi:hypothetical protein